MNKIISYKEAREIAEIAYEEAGYDITDFVGYYVIWAVNDSELDRECAIAINKTEDNGKEFYSIYVSDSDPEDEYSNWHSTNSLDTDELAEKIVEIACDIHKGMR